MNPAFIGIGFLLAIIIIVIILLATSSKSETKPKSSLASTSPTNNQTSAQSNDTTSGSLVSSPPANAILSTPTPTPTSTVASTSSPSTSTPSSTPTSSCVSTVMASSCNSVLETNDYKLVMETDGNLVLYKKSGNSAIWATNTNGKGVGPYRLTMQLDGNAVVYDSRNAALWASGTYGKGTGPYKLVVQQDGNVVIYDNKDTALWASNATPPPATPPAEPIVAKIPTVILPDVNVSLEQYVKYEKVDHVGDDIDCINAPINTCSEKCMNDPLCKSINSFNNGARCCYKRASFPIAENQYVTTYIRKEADSCYSTTNDDKCNNTIETTNYKLMMQPDGNLVLYNKSDNSAVWNSQTYGKGVGPYRLVMQPDGNLVIYDSKNAALWSSGTYGEGKGPYKLVVLNTGYINIVDSTNATIWASTKNALTIINSVISAPAAIVTGIVTDIANLIPAARRQGESCTMHTDCEGYMPLQNTLTCGPNKTCEQAKKDWAGVWHPPQDCLDAPSPLGKPGSCGSGNSWPRKAGQPCDTHFACEGYVALQNTLTCGGNKTCEQAKKDWAGVWHPPQDCVGGIFGRPGTC